MKGNKLKYYNVTLKDATSESDINRKIKLLSNLNLENLDKKALRLPYKRYTIATIVLGTSPLVSPYWEGYSWWDGMFYDRYGTKINHEDRLLTDKDIIKEILSLDLT